jgi:hypothetical protein
VLERGGRFSEKNPLKKMNRTLFRQLRVRRERGIDLFEKKKGYTVVLSVVTQGRQQPIQGHFKRLHGHDGNSQSEINY